MRRLAQPGPASAERIESFRSRCERLEVALIPGLTLAEAITRRLIAAGLHAAVLRIEGLELAPLRCVMPGPADGPLHVAYFSAPREVARAKVEQANVTFGWMEGEARLHCHASWIEAERARRGGHILLDESIVAGPCVAEVWGFRVLGIRAEPDAETNFPLLRPMRLAKEARATDAGHPDEEPTAILARIRPNQDLCFAVEEIARCHGMRDAVVRGSLGSLVGARFADGRSVPDLATEVLIRNGVVRDGVAALEFAVVDMRGEVHVGQLERGENAVCITFDVMLESV